MNSIDSDITIICRPIGMPFVNSALRIDAQVAVLAAVDHEKMLAAVEIADQRRQSDDLRGDARGSRSGDAHTRHRTEAEDEKRIQRNVEHDVEQEKQKGRARIAGAAQGHAEKRQQIEERHADEDDAQVGHRQRLRVGRCAQPAHQHLRTGESDSGNQDRYADKEHNAGADHALGPVDVLRAHALADQDRRRHADAEHGAEQEEQDRVGVRGGGERGFAEAVADPDRVD
jgi:hypothetical protein